MKAEPKRPALWEKIAAIERMERGKLCPMRGGAFYNHQTWEKGRNIVRYVPQARVAHLQKAIAGYQRYLELTLAHADEVITRTRQTQFPKNTSPAIKKAEKQKPP